MSSKDKRVINACISCSYWRALSLRCNFVKSMPSPLGDCHAHGSPEYRGASRFDHISLWHWISEQTYLQYCLAECRKHGTNVASAECWIQQLSLLTMVFACASCISLDIHVLVIFVPRVEMMPMPNRRRLILRILWDAQVKSKGRIELLEKDVIFFIGNLLPD
jgi:hypothetical protein